MLEDARERLIDLGITDGNVNTAQEYVLDVDGLTEANFVSVGYGGNTLETDGLTVKVSDFGKIYGAGELEIKYIYDGGILTHILPVVFATKVLNNASDLNTFLTYADAYDGTLNDKKYDGYFALGSDIEFNGKYVPSMVVDFADIGDKALGFCGVFDGRGHNVNGMYVESASYATDHGHSDAYRRTGFISVLSKNGVIKDVSFTNAKVQYCSYLASWGEGIIENVYVGYNGVAANGWNSTVNTKLDAGAAVTMKNCIISYDTDWESGYILGQTRTSDNAYKNVYIVGPSGTTIVKYSNDETNGNDESDLPLRYDNFKRYSSAGEMLSERKNEINGWNYFSASGTQLSFGSKGLILSATEVTKSFTGNTIISADGSSSNYVIIYENGNDNALKAAGFIAEQIRRASGTVTYADIGGGRFSETISGGVRLEVTTTLPDIWTESSAYIVVGDTDIENAPKAGSGRFVVKTVGNTAFINADSGEEYITAAIVFLEESIGYNALSDDTVLYERVNGTAVTMPEINIDYDSAFNFRNTTNAYHVWKNDQLGLNGRDRFPIGPADDEGIMHPFHNTTYWLKYSQYGATHPKWFRNNGADICYAAGGTQDSSNAEYVAMVAETATNIRDLLNAYPNVYDVTFSLTDNDEDGCQCSVCQNNHTNAAVKFLNDVVAKIQEMDGNKDRKFTVYILAYYYLLDAPTIEMSEHLGVIYGPIRNSREAESIYSKNNDNARTQISAWVAKTKNIGFWFYGTMFHNYMMFTDTVNSLLTWFEYAARTVKVAGGEPVWIYVNGQTRERGASAFEAFKQYAFSKAQVEILEKITATGGTESYQTQIDAYALELESKFFGFTVNGETKTFRDGGYYGAAKANEAMYNLYLQMKEDYGTIEGTNDGTVYEYLDAISYSGTFGIGTKTANRLCDYLEKDKTDGYWKYYTQEMIKTYMSYIETAQKAISAYNGDMKLVYERHILIESLSPRFMICVAGGSDKSGYGFKDGYNGTSISALRQNLKTDFDLIGRIYYGENYLLSDLYSNWGINA